DMIIEMQYETGTYNVRVSIKMSHYIEKHGFDLISFKTCTPPRVNNNSIDYSKTEIQPADEHPKRFSYETTDQSTEQIPCWLTYTNENTHKVINDNLTLSAMYSGMKRGTGPSYCPSIEDKLVRLSDKPRHQVFLEPEGRNTEEVYVQCLSTSLPEYIQHDIVRSVPGLENAEMMRSGYAIEYDSLPPTQLWPTLE